MNWVDRAIQLYVAVGVLVAVVFAVVNPMRNRRLSQRERWMSTGVAAIIFGAAWPLLVVVNLIIQLAIMLGCVGELIARATKGLFGDESR